MPKILDRLVDQLMDKGIDKDKAYAIAVERLQKSGVLKQGTTELTAYGEQRNAMSPEERAKDRAAKKSGGKPSDYKYNPKNNTAVKGKVNPNVKRRK